MTVSMHTRDFYYFYANRTYKYFVVVVVGFEVAELSVEETTTSEISVQVVLLQNQADREVTIGVQTVDGSAKGK